MRWNPLDLTFECFFGVPEVERLLYPKLWSLWGDFAPIGTVQEHFLRSPGAM